MEQLELLRFTIDALERLGIPYAVVGSYASGVWGEPRMTHDIDVVLRLDSRQVDQLCDAFGSEEFYVNRAAAQEAVRLKRPFNVLYPATANKIDFLPISSSAWEQAQLDRRNEVELCPDQRGYVAAPEDVILGKLVYYNEGGSEKHLRDITGIVVMQDESLDRAYIEHWATQLGLIDEWRKVIARCEEQR